MFDAKFWEEVKTNYPEAYDDYFLKDYVSGIFIDKYNYILDKIKKLCYDDIETYFDGLGIEIEIHRNYVTTPNNVDFKYFNNTCGYVILQQDFPPEYNLNFNSRSEAKLAAVKKTFEIRELQLKEVK